MKEELEDRLEEHFAKLVPDTGNAGTVQGEVVRALMKIAYRNYNDGDKFYEGYGCETAGPAATFLSECEEISADHRSKFYNIIWNQSHRPGPGGKKRPRYEKFLESLTEAVLDYVEKEPKLVKSDVDMLNTKSSW